MKSTCGTDCCEGEQCDCPGLMGCCTVKLANGERWQAISTELVSLHHPWLKDGKHRTVITKSFGPTLLVKRLHDGLSDKDALRILEGLKPIETDMKRLIEKMHIMNAQFKSLLPKRKQKKGKSDA